MAACSPRAPGDRSRASRYLPRPVPTSPPSPLSPDRTSLRSSTPSLASCRSDTNLVVRSPKLFSCRLGVPGGGGACGPASAIAPARRLPSARPGQAGAATTSASVPHRPAAGASVAASASAPRSSREPRAILLCGYGRKIWGTIAKYSTAERGTKTTQGFQYFDAEAGGGRQWSAPAVEKEKPPKPSSWPTCPNSTNSAPVLISGKETMLLPNVFRQFLLL